MPDSTKYTSFRYNLDSNDKFILQTAASILFKDVNLSNTEVFQKLRGSPVDTRNVFLLELICDIKDETDVILDYELDPDRIKDHKTVTEKELLKYRKKAKRPLLILVASKHLFPVLEVKQVLAEFENQPGIESLLKEVTQNLATEFFTREVEGISIGLLKREIENILQIQNDIRTQKSRLQTIRKQKYGAL